jgi:hypothetical protein
VYPGIYTYVRVTQGVPATARQRASSRESKDAAGASGFTEKIESFPGDSLPLIALCGLSLCISCGQCAQLIVEVGADNERQAQLLGGTQWQQRAWKKNMMQYGSSLPSAKSAGTCFMTK